MIYKTLHRKLKIEQNTNGVNSDEYISEHNLSPLVLSYHFQLGPEHPDFSVCTFSKLVAFESDIIRCCLSVPVHLNGFLCGAVVLLNYIVCMMHDNIKFRNMCMILLCPGLDDMCGFQNRVVIFHLYM